MQTDTIYITGLTPDGIPLVGGIWRLYRQEGFPVDLSLLTIREKELVPDIMELFAEATIHYELPQAFKQCPEIFTDEAKTKWLVYLKANGENETDQFQAAEKILLQKRSNGIKKEDHGRMILACLALREKSKQAA
jgi:hypothetical protein